MPLYKIIKTDYIKSDNWLQRMKSYASQFKFTCWCCNLIDSNNKVYHKHPESQGQEVISDTVCLCSDCYKSVNRIMFIPEDFVLMLQYLKQKMFKNDYNRILTYSQVKDFKEEYLQEQIDLYKKTKDANLQHSLIKKVLSLPT